MTLAEREAIRHEFDALVGQCLVIRDGLQREADAHRDHQYHGSSSDHERAIYCDGKVSAFKFIIGKLEALVAALPAAEEPR
jgi:hypothetical protein